jgi:hypothetical protein
MVAIKLFLMVVAVVGCVLAITVAALYRLNKAVDPAERP